MSPDYLKDLLRKVKSEYDIDELSQYRAFFKKHIPFGMRNWVAAAMMLEIDSKDPAASRGNTWARSREMGQDLRGRRKKRAEKKEKAAGAQGIKKERNSKDGGARISLPESEAETLFFGIGKKRRVFPRDIVGFLLKETSIEREELGEIRILDNYSFVQVKKEKAETLLDELKDINFRGRKLTVNYARKKSEED